MLIGEVSMVNDDKNDNRFYVEQPRFPTIVEDENLFTTYVSNTQKQSRCL